MSSALLTSLWLGRLGNHSLLKTAFAFVVVVAAAVVVVAVVVAAVVVQNSFIQ